MGSAENWPSKFESEPPPTNVQPTPKIFSPSVVNELIDAPEPWFLMTVFAAHGCTAPVIPSREPMPHCCEPLSVLKPPPTITRPLAGCTTIVLTMRSAVGAHGRSAPVVASAAARRVARHRGECPTDVKSPPK